MIGAHRSRRLTVTAVSPTTGIEVVARHECVALLGTQQVGRLALIDSGRPHIVPLNYALDGESVVFRSFPGTKIDRLTAGPVAFEVDEVDPRTRSGWSVVVHGRAEEVTAYDHADLRERIAHLDLRPWAPGDKPHLVRIIPKSITGRRIRASDDA
jgi:nitroimidazol reductase NimA-like FMN-containing flavoprotein (pyridoxamine 5'-phosphate oxidase superfamily)